MEKTVKKPVFFFQKKMALLLFLKVATPNIIEPLDCAI